MIIPEWKRVLRRAWSIRLAVIAGVFSGAEGVLPLFTDSVPRGVFAALSVVFGIGSVVSRFIMQKSLRVRHGDD